MVFTLLINLSWNQKGGGQLSTVTRRISKSSTNLWLFSSDDRVLMTRFGISVTQKKTGQRREASGHSFSSPLIRWHSMGYYYYPFCLPAPSLDCWMHQTWWRTAHVSHGTNEEKKTKPVSTAFSTTDTHTHTKNLTDSNPKTSGSNSHFVPSGWMR